VDHSCRIGVGGSLKEDTADKIAIDGVHHRFLHGI
jgi:hypothetical protein